MVLSLRNITFRLLFILDVIGVIVVFLIIIIFLRGQRSLRDFSYLSIELFNCFFFIFTFPTIFFSVRIGLHWFQSSSGS